MALCAPPSTGGVFFSGKRRLPAGWQKKLQALSNSFVAVLVERRNSHHVPEAYHVDPNVSTTNQVSALRHDITDSLARDSEPGSGLGACAKTKPHGSLNPAKISGFAEGRHTEVTTNDVNAIHVSVFPDLTQQGSRDSFPLRCRVARVH